MEGAEAELAGKIKPLLLNHERHSSSSSKLVLDRVGDVSNNKGMIDATHLQELDKEHIFDAIDDQPGQLRLNFADEMGQDITPAWAQGIENITLAGMGGSALAADVLKNWLDARLSIPFTIVRGYRLPGYVGPSSLVILSSYSGNTEETLAALSDAQKRSARIVIMTSGGQLLEIATEKKYMTLKLPVVTQPRFGVLAGLRALTCLVQDMGLVGDMDLRRELLQASDWLEVAKSRFSLDNLDGDNPAVKTAEALVGKPVLVYSGQALCSSAYKWKININENAKQLAFYNLFPELNHNEYQGWLFPEDKQLAYVQLQASTENDRIKKRLQITADLLHEHGYQPQIIEAEGTTALEQILWTILYGDYVSAYLGILNGIAPTPVELVEQLKKKLVE